MTGKGMVVLILGFVLVLCTGLLAAAPSERKCSDGIDNDRDGLTDGDDPDCQTGGGGTLNFPQSVSSQWTSTSGANEIFEEDPRPCTLSNSSDRYGSFHCWHVEAPPVFYRLTGGIQTARKGDETFCSTFENGMWLNPNSSYQVDWDCQDSPSSCTVRVLTWSHGEEVRSKVPGVQAIAFEGFSDSAPAWPALLVPDRVEVTFKKDGTNKTIAKCVYSNLGNVLFEQIPVP